MKKKVLKKIIESAWENRSLLEKKETKEAILSVINDLDSGKIRVAEPTSNGWKVNEWVKKAVVLYFPIQEMKTIEAGPLEFHDKIPLKTDFKKRMASDPDTWVMLDDEKYDREDEEPAAWTEQEDKKMAIYYDIINKAHHSIGFDKRHKYESDLDKILYFFGEDC